MSRQVFSANEEPSFSKLNDLSDQTVITCTSGTRPGSPVEGMHIYETNTGLLGFWNGSSWVYYGMGLIDSVGGSTGTGTGGGSHPYGIAGSSTDINGSEFTSIPMYSGHKYRYAGNISVMADANTTDFKMDVYFNGGSVTGESRYISCDVADRHYEIAWSTILTAPSTASYSVKMIIERFAGSGNGAVVSGKDITLEHLGHVR